MNFSVPNFECQEVSRQGNLSSTGTWRILMKITLERFLFGTHGKFSTIIFQRNFSTSLSRRKSRKCRKINTNRWKLFYSFIETNFHTRKHSQWVHDMFSGTTQKRQKSLRHPIPLKSTIIFCISVWHNALRLHICTRLWRVFRVSSSSQSRTICASS